VATVRVFKQFVVKNSKVKAKGQRHSNNWRTNYRAISCL